MQPSLSIIITALVALNLPTAQAQILGSYTERTLSSGGYTSAQVNTISLNGNVIVGTGTTTASGTTTTTAGLAWGTASTTPINLNDDGVTNSQASATDGTSIAGISVTGTTENVVIWSGTNFAIATQINVPFPTYSNINVSGISGSVITGFAVVSGVENAYTYNTATQAAADLNPSGSSGAETFGLSGTTVIGEAMLSGTQRAGVWTSYSAASFVNLGGLLSSTTYGGSAADGLYVGTSSDLIVGSAIKTAGGASVAVAWSGTGSTYTATVLNSTGYTSAYALGTNGTYIVGYGVDAAGTDHALLWTADNTTTAPTSLATYGIPSAGLNSEATGIDLRGDIVGMANGQGFELTAATPEPGSITLALAGGLSVAAAGWQGGRRRTRCRMTQGTADGLRLIA